MCSGSCRGGCSCSSNSAALPIGPMGPAGTDGTNGTNGTNGADGAPGINGTSWRSLCFTGTNEDRTALVPYLECTATVNYKNAPNAQFIYPGTVNASAILQLLANIFVVDGATCSIKIVDLTTGLGTNIIAQATGITSTSNTNIVDMGAITNLPAAEAVFGIFVKTGSAIKGINGRLASLMIGQY